MKKNFVLDDVYSLLNCYSSAKIDLPFPVHFALLKNKSCLEREVSAAEEVRKSCIDPDFGVFFKKLELLEKNHVMRNPDGSPCFVDSGVPMYKNPVEFNRLSSALAAEFSEAITRQKDLDCRYREFLKTSVEIEVTPIDSALLADVIVSEPVARLISAFIE